MKRSKRLKTKSSSENGEAKASPFFWSLLIYLFIVTYFNMLSWEMDNNIVSDMNTSAVLLLLNSVVLLLFYFIIDVEYQLLV